MIDRSRAEFRLANVIDRLEGRWRFVEGAAFGSADVCPVDVAATNQTLVLHNYRLEDFAAVQPGDARVCRPNNIPATTNILDPEQMVVILLCGGLGTRGSGMVYPLLPLVGTGGRTLLDLQLTRLERSPLAQSPVLVFGSLINGDVLQQHLESHSSRRRPAVFCGGIVPRLEMAQPQTGSAIEYRDRHGQASYNPAGHFDALRWLVAGGHLAQFVDREVILIASYSNLGRIFTPETLLLASHTAAEGHRETGTWFTAEVVRRPKEKRTGSLLVTRADQPEAIRLVKYAYGSRSLSIADGPEVLMSTNTLYFSIAALVREMQAKHAAGEGDYTRGLRQLLQPAPDGNPKEACAAFDTAVPVEPHLTVRKTADGVDVLQAERDLDQISLLPGRGVLCAVEVSPERAVSIKVPADLRDPSKRPFLDPDD
jgi:hypothetical protein